MGGRSVSLTASLGESDPSWVNRGLIHCWTKKAGWQHRQTSADRREPEGTLTWGRTASQKGVGIPLHGSGPWSQGLGMKSLGFLAAMFISFSNDRNAEKYRTTGLLSRGKRLGSSWAIFRLENVLAQRKLGICPSPTCTLS